jgi:uncharacterized protein YbbK (DUF523 family)
MEALLISACLTGVDCKYDGGNNALPEAALRALSEKYRLVPVCPEMLGGLSSPRSPCEHVDGRVLNREGEDVTAAFRRGAEAALRLAREAGCRKALLKAKSPSCGSGAIYDGSFSHRVIPGDGAAAELLRAAGLALFDETMLDELL